MQTEIRCETASQALRRTSTVTKLNFQRLPEENMLCAADGGNAARVAREELESKTGRPVVSPLSAKRLFESWRLNLQIDNHDKY